jgi:hypothetical protein
LRFSASDHYVPEIKPIGEFKYICYVQETELNINPTKDKSIVSTEKGVVVRKNDDYIVIWDLESMIVSLIHSDLTFSAFVEQYEDKSILKARTKKKAWEEALDEPPLSPF